MEDKIIKILQSLRAIEPRPDFAHRSKATILATPRANQHLTGIKIRLWESMRFTGALSLASILIFAVLGGMSYFSVKNLAPSVLTGLSDDNLLVEASAADFQIRLNEIKYYEESAKRVTALLNEVSNNEN